MSVSITNINQLSKITPQQVGSLSMKVISTCSGKYTVRVHEVLDKEYSDTKYRYVISIDLRFREFDALRNSGWLGSTKSSALKEANVLNTILSNIVKSLQACEDYPIKGVEFTKKINNEKLERILSKYSCSIE